MSISNLGRVSNSLISSMSTQNLTRAQQSLLDIENKISTGQNLSTPGDDPGTASIIMQLQKNLESQQTTLGNIQQNTNQLSQVDSTLGSIYGLLQQAQNIASQDVGSDVSQNQREGDSNVVQSIYSQILSLGNTQYNGTYLFAGDGSNDPPFVEANGGVQFLGSSSALEQNYGQNLLIPTSASADAVFSSLAGQYSGTANLAPSLAGSARLSDLAGATADGVQLSSIVLSNGTTSKTIDLSNAKSIGDVINDINNAGVGSIAASVAPGGLGLRLSGGPLDNITVSESGNGTTAADLGILHTIPSGAGSAINGRSVGPKLTPFTTLSSLNAGAGVNLSSPITITNGGTSANIDLSSCTTIQDVLNKINGSNTGVRASISSDGTGIDVTNITDGISMSISEDGGTSTAALGIRTFSPSTLLSQLNGGKGVGQVAGNDFQITTANGSNFQIDLGSSSTVQDVINAINTATGASLTASFATTGNGIVLTDHTVGAGSLTVTSLNASTAVKDLGLDGTPVGHTLTGSDVNPITPNGIFAHIAALRDALNNGDQAAITQAASDLQNDYNRVVVARGVNGANIQELSNRQDAVTSQNTAAQTLLSDLQDVDMTTAVTKYQSLQTALQATLQTEGQTLNMSLLDFLS